MEINWSDLLGSVVGVVAAVGVAQWTTRRQISADRELLYEERRHTAVSRALQELLNVPPLTHEIEHFELSGMTDHDIRAYRRQREVLEPLERMIAEFGQALPVLLERQVRRVASRRRGIGFGRLGRRGRLSGPRRHRDPRSLSFAASDLRARDCGAPADAAGPRIALSMRHMLGSGRLLSRRASRSRAPLRAVAQSAGCPPRPRRLSATWAYSRAVLAGAGRPARGGKTRGGKICVDGMVRIGRPDMLVEA